MNAVMLPMWVLSGVFFSSANFPPAAQPLIHVLPLTALNDACRAVMLDGAPVAAIAGELVTLSLWTVVSFALALRLFRWR
jgi:ABC-type polysaccharide/polyol phosphate export permease